MKTLNTRLCEHLGLRIPILQAPMGGATTPELASAVANHGGLGMLPLVKYPLETCEKLITETQALTDKALGVNLILAWDQMERLDMSLKLGIKIVWFFWGDPSPYVEKIHAHGAKVICTVASAKQAKLALEAGVDIIVTQGWEAGGHVYGEVTNFALVPAVIDAIDNKVPVAVAGGIADGRGLAAALSLGADGVVLGTRLLASHEAQVHEQYKQRIIDADETDTVYTDIFDKGWEDAPMRVLRNSTYDQWLNAGKPTPGKRPGEDDVITNLPGQGPVERYSNYLPSSLMSGDLEPMANYAGQGVGLIREKKSVCHILDDVIDVAIQRIQASQSLLL